MPHVYSTLTNDVNYAVYEYDTPLASGHRNARLAKSIIIKGGTNVAIPIKRRGGEPETPLGVRTEVSKEDYELLLQNEVFLNHMERNFIKVENKKTDPINFASKMDLKDISRPRTRETDKESRMPVAQIH